MLRNRFFIKMPNLVMNFSKYIDIYAFFLTFAYVPVNPLTKMYTYSNFSMRNHNDISPDSP